MKNARRLIAVVLCVLLMTSALYGCTVKINVNVDGSGGAVNVVATETPATAAPVTQAPATQAPATQAPASSDPAPADTTAAPADTTAAAPSGNAEPSTTAEIIAEYAKVYNTTKKAGTFLGHDTMSCESVLVEGKENGLIKSAADKFMAASGTDMPLPPYTDDNPGNECLLTADDVTSATYKNNGDGTATITFVPKDVTNSKRFEDPQGKVFNVMQDLAKTMEGIPVVSWAQGDANSNVIMTMKEGHVEVTYNIDTKMMTKADYVLVTYADVTHINVLMVKDKSGQAKFVYTMSYPG